MQSISKTVAGVVLLSLLIFGIAPVLAQSNQATGSSTTSTTTTTTTTQSSTVSSSQATLVIQLAQAAQNYAQQLITIAQNHGLNVTLAQSVFAKGSQLLTSAENELGASPANATRDALRAMVDFRAVAALVQASVVISINYVQQVAALKSEAERLGYAAAALQAAFIRVCTSDSSVSACADAQSNLEKAQADLSNATSQLAALPTPPTQAAMSSIQTLLQDAETHLQAVYSDLKTLASNNQGQRAISFIQNTLLPQVAQLEKRIQNSNISASDKQQYEAQLSQAQTLLSEATQSLQAGNFSAAIHQVQQAMSIVFQVANKFREQDMAETIISNLQARLNKEQQAAQQANLPSDLAQKVQSQLSQAQTLINGAAQAFQSGDFMSGMHQAQQASNLLDLIQMELQFGQQTTTTTTTTHAAPSF